MIRGTTPKHIFTTNIESSQIEKVKIVYCQNNKIILEKNKQDCVLTNYDIEVSLTQEDTFQFDNDRLVDIQLRIKTLNGDVLSTDIITINVSKCLDNEVL